MHRKITIGILGVGAVLLLALGVGVPPEPTAGAQDASDGQAELADLLQSDGLTRAELAGLYQALAPDQYQPPACVESEEMFTDVPATHPFCSWIEELARRGITTGCTATEYCPGNPVNRGQMSVFIVRAMEACPTLDPTDEMIRVGGVCIDKYEASIWDAPVGGNQITGTIPCSPNGQDCVDIYARSVAGVEPRVFITWFQAQAALANSGKRLPTNAEWQMAARGTPDDTGPETTPCNTRSSGVQNTGANPGCVSHWGAFDMVGNVFEWVAEWVPYPTDCLSWGGFSDDSMCFSGASTENLAPGVLIRGGGFLDGAGGGPVSVTAAVSPPSAPSSVGFRGAR